MFKGFTNRCQKIINHHTLIEAGRYNQSIIQPEHILMAILREGQSNAYTIINDIIDVSHFQLILDSHLNKMSSDKKVDNLDLFLYFNMKISVSISERTMSVLHIALREAQNISSNQIDTFMLFLACCEEEGSISKAIIMRHEVIIDDIRNDYYKYIKTKIQDMNNGKDTQSVDNDIEKNNKTSKDDNPSKSKNLHFQKLIDDLNKNSFDINNANKQKVNKEYVQKENQATTENSVSEAENFEEYSKYLLDINGLAMKGELKHIFGREKELDQIFRVLLRKQKNNPVLIGDPGVGKSAIIEEFALKIVEGCVPLPLLNTEILQLDVAALTAGTRYRGDFEERLIGIVSLLQKKKRRGKNPILFIDEFHHIVGAGLANGLSMDGAGILKPALARGNLTCIGITTADEFRKHVETDKAFLRRLQKVDIGEMSEADTYLTLQKIKVDFEEKHSVIYEDETLHEIVRLSGNYIFDRYFPDKAVDVLDEVGAHQQLINSSTPEELSALFMQENQISNEVDALVRASAGVEIGASNYASAGTSAGIATRDALREDTSVEDDFLHIKKSDELESIIERKYNLQKSLIDNMNSQKSIVKPEHVREVITNITGIPIDRIGGSNTDIVFTLQSSLEKNIVGQKHAIQSLVSAIKRNSAGLHKSIRPVGSFMFLGPTGVGKTYTAKQLAKFLLGSEKFVSRFDMSDFSESNSISRLIGSPPGYVGYEESGLLIKLMRRNPRQLLLFDEIEKAHSRVFDIFLQILEEGTLQGQRGEIADFRHSIIVMTSNIGSKDLLAKKDFGFSGEGYSSSFINNIVVGELDNHFKPELINRFDELIVFNPLGDMEIKKVINYMILDLENLLLAQSIRLRVNTSVQKLLYESYYNVEYGARSIRRGIRAIENFIAKTIIDKGIGKGDNISVGARNEKFVLTSCQYNAQTGDENDMTDTAFDSTKRDSSQTDSDKKAKPKASKNTSKNTSKKASTKVKESGKDTSQETLMSHVQK